MVAGFWQANPNLTNMQVIDYIRMSGSIYANPNEKLGYGIANYLRAKDLILSVDSDVENAFRIAYSNEEGKLYLIATANEKVQSFHLSIIDLVGRLVDLKPIRIDSEKTEVFLPKISPGLYILNIEGQGVSQKIKYILPNGY